MWDGLEDDGNEPSVEELQEMIEWDDEGFALPPLDAEDDGDYLDRMLAQYGT